MNTNYDPPQPWRCATYAAHVCDGQVIGALGAYPVCAAGAAAEQVARDADQVRISAWMNSPEGRREIAREQATEHRIEGRR